MKRKSLFEDESSNYQQLVNATSESSKRKSLFEDENSSYSVLVAGENIKEWEAYTKKAYDDYVKKNPDSTLENDEKRKKLYDEYKEASDYLKDYDAYLEQSKLYSMSSGEIDSIISDYDSQIKALKDEGGFISAILPGGITPSDYSANKDKIKQLENEAAKYKTRRDYIKAQEVTSSLPADVIQMLDRYNNLLYSDDGVDNAQMAFSFMGAGAEGGGGNRVQYSSNETARNKIIKNLTNMGYDNYVELAEYRKYITDTEFTQEYTQDWTEFTEAHPIASSAINLALAPGRMISSALGSLESLGNVSDLGLNPNSSYYAFTHANRAKQKAISDSFTDGILSAKTKTFLYNTAESGVESLLAGVTLGPGGGVLLGLGAYGDTVLSTVEKGGSYEDALFSGLLAGTFEGLFESVSIGNLKAFKDVPVNGIKAVLKNVGSGILVNASEETLTEIANVISDYMINGGVSDYYNAVVAYMDEGVSEAEAKSKAAMDMGKRIIEAGASGGLMGFGFGAGGSTMSYVSTAQNRYKSGKDIVKSGDTARLLLGASDVQWEGKDKSIYESVAEAQRKAEETEGYKYSGKEYYNVGKLSDKLNTATTEDRNSIITKAVSERLTALGESGDINLITSAIVKKSTGEKLTFKERSALKDSSYAQRVQNEMGDILGAHSSEWAQQVKSDVSDLYERRYNPSENTQTKKYSDENYGNLVKNVVFNEGQDKTEFNKQFDLFQNYGRQGADFEEVKNTVPESSGFTETQMKAAYDLGAELKEKEKLAVVTGIDSMDGTDIYVTTTTGKKQKLSEINVEAATGNLIRSASKYDIPTANAFIRGYNRSATVSSYARAFDAFYAAGSASADTTFSDAKKKYGELVKYMDSSDVARKAFNLGRAERTKADKSVRQKKQTGKHPAKGTYQSKTVSVGEEAIDEFFTAISKKTGIDIDRVHSIVNRDGQVANAQYDPTRNKMTTSATAENELQASIHELTHAAFAYNAEKMKQVKKAVIDYFLSQNSESEFEEILRQYGASYEGDSRADIEEEFVADALGGMFTTEEGVQNFLEWLQDESGYKAEEKKTILQRITEWLSDIIEAIRDIMNSGELNGAGKLFAKENCDELTRIRKQFLEALDGAAVNYREGGAVEGDVRNEIKVDINGNKFVEVNDKLFDAKSGESHAQTIARIIKDRFDNLISVNGQQIQINKTTNDEWTHSGSARKLLKNDTVAYDDKLKTIPNADEILKVARDWIGEEKYHSKNVDIVEFARGNVLYRVGTNGYVADVIVGIRRNASAVLYDLVKIKGKKITEVPVTMVSENSQRRSATSAKSNISQSNKNVKNQNKVYLESIEKGDIETAQQMVDNYAIEQGFDVAEDGTPDLLFHGTDSFGFTKIDTSKSDDSITFWATPNMGVAGSYYKGSNYKVREIGREKVAPKGEKLYYTSSMEKTINTAKPFASELGQDFSKAKYVKEDKVMRKAEKSMQKAVTASETVLNGDFSEDIKSIAQSVITAFEQGTYDAWSRAINGRSWNKFSEITGVKFWEIDLPEKFNIDKSDISEVTEVDPDVFRMMYHIGDVLEGLELDSEVTIKGETIDKSDIIDTYNEHVAEKGIYGFYHKQNNPFIYDCGHVGWNKIPVPDEAKGDFSKDTTSTRELAEWAFKNGYDAVRLDNVVDVGWYALKEARKPATVWAFKNPEAQLKSADPVTYDDNGNVIPLSERFNSDNSDIRYSKKVDITNKRLTNGKGKGYNKNSTYDEFRTNGMQWAYSAGTEAGDTRHLFNGWNGKHCIIEATKRDVGFIVIEELSSTEWRKKYGRDSKIEEKGRSLHWNIDQYESAQRGPSNNSNSSQHRGKDGRTVQLSEEERFQSNEAGNLERDGQDNQEIQDREVNYSLPINDFESLHRSNIEKVTELGKVTAQMQAHILRIGSNLTKRELSALKIQEVARKLKVDYASKLDIHDLSGRLTELYTLINEGGASYDVLRAHLDDIKERLLKESKYMKPDISDAAKERLREIRKTPVSINETQRAEILSMYGNMTNFRRYTGLQITKDGTPLEMRWSEWADMSGMFDPDISDADMPIRLAEIVGSLKNTYEDESGYDLDSARDQLDADICAAYLEIPTVAELGNRFFEIEQELLTELKEQRNLYTSTFNKTYALARKAAKNDFDRQLVKAKARMETRVQNIADTRIREKKRNRLIKTVKRLDRLLRTPGKGAPSAGTNKYGQDYVHLTNIPEGLKRTVIDFCSIFVDNDAGVFTGKYTDSDNVIRKKINELRKQYQNLKQSDAYIGTSVSDEMTEKIEKLHDIVGEKRLSQLTAAELDTVNEIADHLVAVINNEVEMWVNGKKTKVADVGSTALNELSKKDMKGYILAMKGIDKLNVMNLKPIYFFEKVGGTLETLWKDILGGQDKYVRNMQFAQQRFSEVSKKYHLQEWIDDEAMTFKTAQGHEISLTRGQALLIWATWKREGKAGKDSKHLFEGGIVYPDAVKKASEKGKNKLPEVLQKVYEDGTAHRIRVEDMFKIDKWLTDEQKKYADELVSFLSNDIGAWGNEISMQLYGVNKFNEKYYIPFNSAKNYLYKGMGEEGTKLLKSEGFTNETKWGAANPLVVDDFTDVVVKHIERMSMYNSMVLPLDNFSRVWNYQERANAEGNESMRDVKAAFETAWGKEYKAYVENLLRDVNGGVMTDGREFGDKWLSKFKKAAVMGSLSVMIQQPSAIVRAMSEVDVKYFVSSTFRQRKAAYEEAMKYAPVAVLKEIGGFDTVSGQSMADWMLKREYKGMDKLKAFFKDSQFRDDVLSWGPAWADRVTWAHIWLACKNEVRVKKGLTGEALLEATGERFTDVINKTQVYDSVLSRSDAMRSKSTYMKMTTAFMAEPTTQWNMYGSAVRDFKNGDKKNGARKAAAVIGSQLFNAALVSIIYAARDDEEEETPVEKYISQLVGNFLGSLNPLTLVPFAKDIISLVEGYDVERSDMSVIADLINSVTNLFNENSSFKDKAHGVIGSIGNVFGIPLKNLLRDMSGTINAVKGISDIDETTGSGIIVALRDELAQVPGRFGYDNSKARYLYDAFVDGDEGLYAEYASRYKDGKAVKSAITGQIKERYVSGDLTDSEAEELLGRLGYGSNEVYYKLREWSSPAQEEEDSSDGEEFLTLDGMKEVASEEAGGVKYTYLHYAIASGDTAQIKKEAQDLYDRGAEKEKVRSSLTTKWKKEYLAADANGRVKIREYLYATGAYDSLAHLDEYLKRWRESEQK